MVDPNRMRNISVINLFCNTIICSLKQINTIYPKTNDFLNNLAFGHTITNHQNLHKNVGQVIIP
jgi:hypothetical protein